MIGRWYECLTCTILIGHMDLEELEKEKETEKGNGTGNGNFARMHACTLILVPRGRNPCRT